MSNATEAFEVASLMHEWASKATEDAETAEEPCGNVGVCRRQDGRGRGPA